MQCGSHKVWLNFVKRGGAQPTVDIISLASVEAVCLYETVFTMHYLIRPVASSASIPCQVAAKGHKINLDPEANFISPYLDVHPRNGKRLIDD
jgi:hypothetical protein